jgi:hypothetical protein
MADALTHLFHNQQPSSRSINKQKRSSKRWILPTVTLLLGLVLFGQLGYYVLIAPRLLITRVEVNGLYGLTDQEILAAGGIHSGMLYHHADPDQIRLGILSLAQIRDLEVERIFPGTIRLNLELRTPLALVFEQGNFYHIDKEGVVFASRQEQLYQGPILSGLTYEQWGDGYRVPYKYRAFLADLESIKLEQPHVFRLFSQFMFQQESSDGFSVWLYPTHLQNRVRLGSRFTPDQALMLIRVLHMLEGRPDYNQINEIDFRTGNVIISRAGGAQ